MCLLCANYVQNEIHYIEGWERGYYLKETIYSVNRHANTLVYTYIMVYNVRSLCVSVDSLYS